MENNIVIFQKDNFEIEFKADFNSQTIWATQSQIAELFEINRTTALRHINNILKDEEVDRKSNVQKMHIPNSDKLVEFYNLYIIIAVGFKTNSKRAIIFRSDL